MNLDRFQPPTARDDLVACVGCYELWYYTSLDEEGRCCECRKPKDYDEPTYEN